ncbi:MAG TPA: hypothetical protein VFB45_12245 [Pseudolabrys sp.]|nr:hypothetical protein [Pseudolabrys sp.]
MDKLILALLTSAGLALALPSAATASTLKSESAVAAGSVTTLSADGYEGRRHYRHHYRYYRYSCRIGWPCPTRDPYAPRKDLGYYYWPGGPVPPFWWGL